MAVSEPAKDQDFIAAIRSATHLADYVSMLKMRGYAMPIFVKKLEREHGALKDPNLIYPLSDTVFVHINSFGQLHFQQISTERGRC